MTDTDQKLMELLKLHNTNRLDYNTRKWETLKFFQTIITALLTAIVAGILAMYKLGEWGNCIYRIPIATLTFIPIISAFYSIKNLNRESELLYLEELQMFKITKLLGLDIPVENKDRWLPCDEFLLLTKWRSNTFGTGNIISTNESQWLEARVRNHKFLDIFNLIFIIEIIISLTLLLFTIFS